MQAPLDDSLMMGRMDNKILSH